MMTKLSTLLLVLALLAAAPARAQPGGAEPPADGAQEEEPGPTPTPANRSFPCVVDAPGERCTVPLGEGDEIDGVVAYRSELTGKWIDFGWGPFNRDGQPHGCGWVLDFRERLVEERGCFQDGKRQGTWETCRMRLGETEPRPNLKCPKTEYENGVVIVKPPEPEPEPVDEDAATGEGADDATGGSASGVKPETEKAGAR